VTVFDNDPAVTVDKSTVMDTEGGVGDSFSVVLNAPPVMSSWLSAGANDIRLNTARHRRTATQVIQLHFMNRQETLMEL